ncbi:MAG: protocatechuate 3,4-dioxygenase [Oceanospirillaceae bacterium]|nr:protocatechuate 3,4-dioxygenase [Oceanospirillaceae bacterium]
MKFVTRRGLLKSSIAIASLSVFSRNAAASILTPSTTEGPFYPTAAMRFSDVDNDLVKIIGIVNEAGGEVIHLKGRLLTKDGKALAGHRIEIWQCDVNGKYLHSGDNRSVVYDNGFQGFGHDISDIDGNYSFTTIKPTVYPGRTPHIHVKVLDGQRELLTTQFYIAGDKGNQADSLFRRMSAAQARSVSMVFTKHNNMLETSIDLII